MGSHYINVGNIKFDQELLDVVCPAVGYTPEIMCPAAGWTPPEPDGQYEPPVIISEPSTDEIKLLCSNDFPAMVYFRVYGNYTVEIWDSQESVMIQTSDHASGAYYTYNFPTATPALFVVKIKGRGASITTFRCYPSAPYDTNWPILQAIFNTPNITTLSYAFSEVKKIKKVDFVSTLNSLTLLEYFLNKSGIENFKFPSSLPALLSLNYCFYQSEIRVLDLNSCNMPELSFMNYFLSGAINLHTLTFNPSNVKKLRNMTSAFSYLRKLKDLFMDCELGENMAAPTITMDQAFEYSDFEKITLFVGHTNYTDISCSNMFRSCVSLKEIIFRGRTILQDETTASNTPKLTKIQTGAIMNQWYKVIAGVSAGVELIIDAPTDACTGYFQSGLGTYKYLKELNNKPTWSIDQSITLLDEAFFLKRLDQPYFLCSRLMIGCTGGPLEYVEVDWVNSSLNFGADGQIIVILKGNLSASEINRIFSKLPPRIRSIDVRDNPGYADCDTTIATAKGWIVL